MYKIKMFIMGLFVSSLFLTSAIANECTSEELILGDVITSEWTGDCDSTHRTGSYAKYYTFTLDSAAQVVIDLGSNVDTYLYLISGTNQSSAPIIENDDYEGSPTSSQITMNLQAGTYTIEATTYNPYEFASFELSLTGTVSCTSEIILGSIVSGEWSEGCDSIHQVGSYAKYYTFTLDTPRDIAINLNTSMYPVLFLLPDTNQSSEPIASGNNGLTVSNLQAGTYMIEATTYDNARTGNFELSLSEAITRQFKGEVTLPKELTNLLDSCDGSDCPSISINVSADQNVGWSWGGASVDYNDTSLAYEYSFEITNAKRDANYQMYMYISNGDRGNESLVYSFGTDNQVGGTDDASDVMYHQDELWYGETHIAVEPLLVSALTDRMIVDLDFTNKNVGRHKVIGKIHLPFDINLSDSVEEDGYFYYINDLSVQIQGPNTWGWATVNRIAEGGNNDYSFVTSVTHNLPEPSKLSISVSGRLYDHQIQASYKVDPDNKFVSGWLDSSENYVEFTQTVADFGTMDLAVFLDGYEVLTGSIKAPDNFMTRGADRSLNLRVYGNTFNGYSNIYLYDYNESTPPQFSILIPGSEKETIKTEGLKFSIDFNWWDENYNTYGYFNSYYTFGEDKAIGGTGVNEDYLLEGCIDYDAANELIVSVSSSYPVVNMDLSNYSVPYTFKAIGTLPVPSEIGYFYFSGRDTSCNNGGTGGWSQNNGDGTWSYEITNLLEGNTYAIHVHYSGTSNPNNWYEYVLNDTDMDLTTEGVFLDEIRYEETVIYPDPLATITGSADDEIVISPFEFILPASSKAVSPAIIMYLLN